MVINPSKVLSVLRSSFYKYKKNERSNRTHGDHGQTCPTDDLNQPGNDADGIEMENYGAVSNNFDLESTMQSQNLNNQTNGNNMEDIPTVSGDAGKFIVEQNGTNPQTTRLYNKIFHILLAVVILFCVVASKLTIIAIAKALQNRTPNLIDVTGRKHKFLCNLRIENATHIYLYGPHFCQREVTFLMLTFILMIPPAVTLIKVLVKIFRKVACPWPTKEAVSWVSSIILSKLFRLL